MPDLKYWCKYSYTFFLPFKFFFYGSFQSVTSIKFDRTKCSFIAEVDRQSLNRSWSLVDHNHWPLCLIQLDWEIWLVQVALLRPKEKFFYCFLFFIFLFASAFFMINFLYIYQIWWGPTCIIMKGVEMKWIFFSFFYIILPHPSKKKIF